MKTMNDSFGRKIEVGQFVAYAVRSGNSGSLRIGKVIKINNDSISIRGGECDYSGTFAVGKIGTFYSFPENVVIIDVPTEFKKLYV